MGVSRIGSCVVVRIKPIDVNMNGFALITITVMDLKQVSDSYIVIRFAIKVINVIERIGTRIKASSVKIVNWQRSG